MPDASDLELTETERDALHECQVAIEYVYRAYGDLLDFHHNLGHAMDRFQNAEDALRAASYEGMADELRDEYLPAGVTDDTWSYEIVDEFQANFLADITDFEDGVREDLADGVDHVTERRQQREWRERAGRDE